MACLKPSGNVRPCHADKHQQDIFAKFQQMYEEQRRMKTLFLECGGILRRKSLLLLEGLSAFTSSPWQGHVCVLTIFNRI